MAQIPTATPMSPTGELAAAPLAPETHLQPSSEAAPQEGDSSNTTANAPVATPETAQDSSKTTANGIAATPATTADASSAAPAETGTATPAAAATETETETAAKATGLVVHHLNNSRSQRLLWLLEELEVPYTIQKYERNEEMRAPKELRDVHPLGKSPVITDGDVTLAESGAITEYVISKYGEKFRPTDAGKIDDLYFTHYAEGSLMPLLLNKYIFSLVPQRAPLLVRPLIRPIFSTLDKKLVEPQLKAHCALIEKHLEDSKTGWLAGGEHPTSADFMMAFPAEMLAIRLASVSGPKIKEYVKRIHERPAYKRGVEKGGKYDYV